MLIGKKIAIVYDWMDKWGGVERVLLMFHEMFPNADFFTSYFDPITASWAKQLKIKTSFIQKFPRFIRRQRILSLPFYPFAFESFNFNDYDLVISVTSSFAKAIITQPKTKHICYLLTPTRFLWSHEKEYLKKSYELGVRGYLKYLKNWDLTAAQRPDKIISISKTVKDRCEKYYKRNSEIIYPPFDFKYWKNIKYQISNIRYSYQKLNILKNKKFFLLVSRLEPYKKVDLAIKVFNKLKHNLVIVGQGTLENKLKKIANKNILFLSDLNDYELGFLYFKAVALIMPQEEDFGYVSLEGQFFECPVISYKNGGAAETIIDGKTGLLIENQTESSLKQAVERFEAIKYNLRNNLIKFKLKNLEKFNKEKFIKQFNNLVIQYFI